MTLLGGGVIILQWNYIEGSINIDNLRFNSLSLGRDSFIIKYLYTKKDKEGKNTSPKNFYAKPFDPFIYLFTSLGC